MVGEDDPEPEPQPQPDMRERLEAAGFTPEQIEALLAVARVLS